MVYKLGTDLDMATLPSLDAQTEELLYVYTSKLSSEYGDARDIDHDDGGYVLYAPPGTDAEEIKVFFDYSRHMPEYVDRYGHVCVAMYVLHNEFAVVIVMSVADAPEAFVNEC